MFQASPAQSSTMKYFVFVCLFVVVYGDNEDYYRKLDKLTQEHPCSRVGGTCTFAADCPQLAEKSGLCPQQQSQGVECCYGKSSRDTRCNSQGGMCIPSSNMCGVNDQLVFERATDCPSDQKCCILV